MISIASMVLRLFPNRALIPAQSHRDAINRTCWKTGECGCEAIKCRHVGAGLFEVIARIDGEWIDVNGKPVPKK